MGLNLLIVDDDRDFAESLADVFELHGHLVSVACTGEQAIELYQQSCYDLALLDVRLPGMNGVESFAAMRAIRPQARVIMMTGYSIEGLVQEAVDQGALGVFHKPLDMERVLFTLERVLPTGILVVDDDPDSATSIADLVTRRGYRAIVANGGRAAMDEIRSQPIDVLLLDLRMPTVDGYEVYRQMTAHGGAIPTVIITAYAREEAERVRSLPVAAVLSKPIDPEVLMQKIEKLVGSRKL